MAMVLRLDGINTKQCPFLYRVVGRLPDNQNVIVDISLPLSDAALMDVLGLFQTGDLSISVTMRMES
jgi:hypothetical protein